MDKNKAPEREQDIKKLFYERLNQMTIRQISESFKLSLSMAKHFKNGGNVRIYINDLLDIIDFINVDKT